MPWTTDDVEKHKKGLSDEGKKRWVATANSALAACIKKGGTDATCAPQAIRIANGVTGNEQYFTIHTGMLDCNYTMQIKKHQGRNHVVVPVIMMVEGVHRGSHGALLHLINDLGKFPEAWNGIPVVINHPVKDGVNVSANSPDIVDEQIIGRVYNAHVKDNAKLAAEVWIDEERIKQISANVLRQLQEGKTLEVSLGVFNEEEYTPGEWNGEHYDAIARNHRPDHLALLPDGVGACSVADGCGIRVNSDDQAIEPMTVRTIFSNNVKLEDNEMAEKVECTPCVKKKVDDLIANSQGKYTDTDREMLETLSESVLDKIAQPVVVEKEVIVEKEKTIEVNVLTDTQKAALAYGEKLLKEKRDNMVKGIQDNAGKENWPDDVLVNMDESMLERVFNSVKKVKEAVHDYSLNGGIGLNVNTGECKEPPMAPTGIVFKTK